MIYAGIDPEISEMAQTYIIWSYLEQFMIIFMITTTVYF
jgi:hypothetical protein